MAPIDVSSVITPTNIGAVPKLLSEVASAGEALSRAGDDSITARRELLAKTRELTRALETPREIMIQQIWAQPSNVMAISFGVQSGLWTAMSNNGDGPQKVVDLAKQLGIQEELLSRMMRHIAAFGYIDMTAPDEYTPNSFSKSLTLAAMSSGCHTGRLIHNTKLHWFAHLHSTPPHGQNINDHFGCYLLGRPGWMDEGFYPVKERLFDGFDTSNKDAVLLIDVGGGFGHYTEELLSKFPNCPGRLILQDLPPVIGRIQQLHPRIEKMEYDFFTEQPVKGARVYYMHFILHDWPDEQAIKIGNRVGEAMKPGYSKFLIHEHVVPPMGQDYEQTASDIIMMTSFGSKERSSAQWSEIMEKCGLKIVKIWTPINGIESIVECERPE
ncbi:S-adenosyl-L-methionine-dependent methyltransferase [Annulohypoxylon nitens]|nr:S-adenosyl-L-methionine-dependent methyltransferase [Annulohypoxylon nitens]